MESFEFLRDLALLMITSKLLEVFLQRYRLSKIVPYIVAGLIWGPCLFGIVQDSELITYCAKIGAVLLVYDVGLSTDIHTVRNVPRPVILIAGFGVLFSLLAGAVIYMIFYGFGPIGSENLLKGLFFGIILSSSSIYAMKRIRKQIGGLWDTVLTAAVLNNMLVIIVLTLALGVKTNDVSIWMIALRAVMLAVLGYAAGLLIRFVINFLSDNYPRFQSPAMFYFSYCLLMAYFSARYFGLSDVTGAYIAGVVVHALIGPDSLGQKDMEFYSFFTSLFFMGIGLSTSLGSVDMRLIIFGLAMIVFGLTAKTIGCGIGAMLGKYEMTDSMRIAVSMMSQAELSLIAVWKGIEAGLLGTSYMIPAICLVFGALFILPNALKRVQ